MWYDKDKGGILMEKSREDFEITTTDNGFTAVIKPVATVSVESDGSIKIIMEHDGKKIGAKISLYEVAKMGNIWEEIEMICRDLFEKIKKGENNNG